MSVVLLTIAVGLVGLFVWATLVERLPSKLRAWLQLHSRGPADLAYEILQHSPTKVETVDTLHHGRITYIGRYDVAQQVFVNASFTQRLGSGHGLQLLGMYNQGIIWNNDTTSWETKRKVFSQGIQGLIQCNLQYSKSVCIDAFKLTLAEHCHKATHAGDVGAGSSSSSSWLPQHLAHLPAVSQLASLPLSELAAAVAGLKLDLLPDGRDFFRLITFRVTAALALGLPVDALPMHEALKVVYAVADFFKAWEYFLLRPAWLCRLTSWTPTHRRHLAAIKTLQAATARLIQLALEHQAEAMQHAGPSQAAASCPQPSATRSSSIGSAANTAASGTTDGTSGSSDSNASGTSSTCVPFARTFLGMLQSQLSAGELSQEAVQQLVLEMMLAGTDTSSISLYYLMVQLQDDPELEGALLHEVLQAAGNIQDLSNHQLADQLPITYTYDPQLPRLQAALSEAMRYKPVGPVVIRQARLPVTLTYIRSNSHAGGGSLEALAAHSHGAAQALRRRGCHNPATPAHHHGGHQQQHKEEEVVVQEIAAGDTVIISLAAMHRDPGVFPDSEAFSPFTNFDSVPQGSPATAPGTTATTGSSSSSSSSLFDTLPRGGGDVSGNPASASSRQHQHQPCGVFAAATSKDNHMFRPFGHGKKGCVGLWLGWLEMKMILSCWLLVLRFRSPQQQAEGTWEGPIPKPAEQTVPSISPAEPAVVAAADGDEDAAAADDASALSRSDGSSSACRSTPNTAAANKTTHQESQPTARAGSSTSSSGSSSSSSTSSSSRKNIGGKARSSGTDGKPPGRASSLLDSLQLKWDVASQPVNPVPLHAQCVYVAGPTTDRTSPGSNGSNGGSNSVLYIVGAHGAGKTTLARDLLAQLHASGVEEVSFATGAAAAAALPPAGPQAEAEAAAADGSASVGAACTALPGQATPARFTCVASLATATATATDTDTDSVAARPGDAISSAAPGTASGGIHVAVCLVTETARCVMKAYSIDQDMLVSSSARHLCLQRLIVQEQLQREKAAAAAVAAAAACISLVVSDRSVLDALAYAADRVGEHSAEVHDLVARSDVQQLLERCRSHNALVVLLPPHDGGRGPPEDDGVRLLSPTLQLTARFEALMQQLGVPYEVVRSTGREQRVAEVLSLMGWRGADEAAAV